MRVSILVYFLLPKADEKRMILAMMIALKPDPTWDLPYFARRFLTDELDPEA